MQILKEEYGIETPAQLYEAVEQLGGIDITPFVAKPQNSQANRIHEALLNGISEIC